MEQTYYQKHKDERLRKQHEYFNNNKASCNITAQKYYWKNKEKCKEYQKTYRQKYKQLPVEQQKILSRERYKKVYKDSFKRLKANICRRIWETLRYQGIKRTLTNNELIGCSDNELKLHIEKQFKDGMTWENYGNWHADHIRAVSTFNLNTEDEQIKCFHWSNLQPLWARDNQLKGKIIDNDKVDHEISKVNYKFTSKDDVYEKELSKIDKTKPVDVQLRQLFDIGWYYGNKRNSTSDGINDIVS